MILELDASQRAAVQLATVRASRIALITGGPGTGKTTCLSVALDLLRTARQTFALAAPTGKAAKRMTEATGCAATTIHRLLGCRPGAHGRPTWVYGEGNPLPLDVVLIDESSMVDIELFHALLAAIDPARTRLVMIGDADQLPPVGPGRPFADLIASGVVPTARLTQLHRSAAQSWICENAPRVLAGNVPLLGQRADFRYVPTPSAADVVPTVVQLVTQVLPREYNAQGQVLIPQRTLAAGVNAANAALQAALNPLRPGDHVIERRDAPALRQGDRVIQTRNNYQLEVFNGEVGEITDLADGSAFVHLDDGRVVRYSRADTADLQHSYALTVHRSQGSEFPWVVVVCHSTHAHVLSRQLLYTAITRAKVGVILVGDERGLKLALDDKRRPRRNTTLVERLKGEIAA